MNEFEPEVQSTIHELTEAGREKLALAQDQAEDVLAVVTDYIRANPWVAVAGAAALGGAIALLTKPTKQEPRNLDGVRTWLADAYAKLPSTDDVQSAVKTSGLPDLVEQLKRKLHLN